MQVKKESINQLGLYYRNRIEPIGVNCYHDHSSSFLDLKVNQHRFDSTFIKVPLDKKYRKAMNSCYNSTATAANGGGGATGVTAASTAIGSRFWTETAFVVASRVERFLRFRTT